MTYLRECGQSGSGRGSSPRAAQQPNRPQFSQRRPGSALDFINIQRQRWDQRDQSSELATQPAPQCQVQRRHQGGCEDRCDQMRKHHARSDLVRNGAYAGVDMVPYNGWFCGDDMQQRLGCAEHDGCSGESELPPGTRDSDEDGNRDQGDYRRCTWSGSGRSHVGDQADDDCQPANYGTTGRAKHALCWCAGHTPRVGQTQDRMRSSRSHQSS